MKRSCSTDQVHHRFKKRGQIQEEPRSAKVKFEKRGTSPNGNLHVSLLEKGTMGNAKRVPGVSLVVVKKDTR